MKATVQIHALTGLLLLATLPARAGDSFSRGCQLYTAKNYSQAEVALCETVKKYPNFWPGHYYLAHTLLAEGKKMPARTEYEACLTCTPAPGADVLAACQKVIVTLGGTVAPPAGDTAAAPADGAADTKAMADAAAGEKKEGAENYRETQKRLHIERLRRMCAEKIAALREECKEALAYATSQASTYFKISPDGLGKSIQLSDEEQARIEKEYQDKITKVQEDTDRQIAGLN